MDTIDADLEAIWAKEFPLVEPSQRLAVCEAGIQEWLRKRREATMTGEFYVVVHMPEEDEQNGLLLIKESKDKAQLQTHVKNLRDQGEGRTLKLLHFDGEGSVKLEEIG